MYESILIYKLLLTLFYEETILKYLRFLSENFAGKWTQENLELNDLNRILLIVPFS